MKSKSTYIATAILNLAVIAYGIMMCWPMTGNDIFEAMMIVMSYMLITNLIVGTALVLLSFVHKPLFDHGILMLKLFLVILLLWVVLWWTNREKMGR